MAVMKRKFTEEFMLGLQLLSMRDEVGASEGLKFPDDRDLTPYEKIHFVEAYNKNYNPTAIFFRRFGNDRPPMPAVYIYDFTADKKSEDELKDLYKKLWNSCKVPFFIVFEKEEVRIFNLYGKSGKDIDKKLTPYEIIKIAAGAESEFNARNIFTGSLWESDKASKEIKKVYGAYESFLAELKVIRKQIEKDAGFKPEIAKSLLIKFILLKYLEERRVFRKGFWNQFYKDAVSFLDTFNDSRAVVKVLDYLGSHFNGGIFRLEEKEKEEILKSDLSYFASFLKAESEDNQLTLWRIYSFEFLPVELISNIYEDFLENKSGGIVYTPPLLVDFMIDEVMPLDKPKENFSVFDPACGSGIFLVAAYKRMIQWWMLKNGWKKPDEEVLKKILKNSIFGTDIYNEASQLAIFSLSLALCDVLSPDVIWNKLKFDDLSRENILSKDFFEIVQGGEFNNRFDLVIGNPPFESRLTKAAEAVDAEEKKKRGKLPDNQIALLFLEQSFELCKKDGYVCLIQSAGPLLYNQQSMEFRKQFFEKVSVNEVIDFTCFRTTLFNSTDVTTAVIICENNEPDKRDILHITVRETNSSREKICFELDKYDFHYVNYDEAVNNKYIWKVNLLGGGRLKHLINRLSNKRTLKQFLKEKVKNEGWLYQEGFTKARIEPGPQLIRADYLYKSKYLKPEALDIDGIDFGQVTDLKCRYFKAPGPKELYKKPMLLIREVYRKEGIPVAIVERDISFSKQIIGIKSNSIKDLNKIYKILHKNKLFSFCIFINSGRLASFHSSILKADIDNLPFPENQGELKLNPVEEIIVTDMFDYMIDYFQGKLNPAILRPVTKKQLSDFGNVYCDLLNSVYKKFIPHEPVIAGQFVCYPFSYGEKSFPDKLDEKDLIELVNKKGDNVLIKRNVRLYDDKLILLIKPRQLRYWMKSIAVRDADETFADLIEMGY